jgi:hypothetical protein
MPEDTGGEIDVQKPYKDAPEHIRRIVLAVLELEKDRLYQLKPRVNGEIIQIIKEHSR